jgi:hypothetical protein
MIRAAAGILSCLLLTACATSSGGGTEGGAPPAGGTELFIRDYMETYLPREAHIALFEIIPERGVSLLYPTRGEEPRQVGPGWFRLPHSPSGFVHAQRDKYITRPTGLLNQAPPRIRGVTILVVTSNHPLDLDLFLSSPGGLRDHLGGRDYVSEVRAVERILATIVPDPSVSLTQHRTATVSVNSAWTIRGGGS